jgi:ribosome-dependent ATPase
MGKQFPYVVVGMLTFVLLVLMALVVFHVPVKGSFGAFALGTLFYVFSTCGFGQLISTFTRTQVAAVFATTVISIITDGELFRPARARVFPHRRGGLMFPMAWFQPISVGAFTKGRTYSDLWFYTLVLAAFAIGYFIAALMLLRKQQR